MFNAFAAIQQTVYYNGVEMIAQRRASAVVVQSSRTPGWGSLTFLLRACGRRVWFFVPTEALPSMLIWINE